MAINRVEKLSNGKWTVRPEASLDQRSILYLSSSQRSVLYLSSSQMAALPEGILYEHGKVEMKIKIGENP